MNDSLTTQAQSLDKDLHVVADLTREYAKFSRDARGLGHVLGAALVFLAILVLPSASAHDQNLSIAKRILLCGLPAIWIAGKLWLQEHYYQSSGGVTQPKSRIELGILGILTAFVAVVNLIVSGVLSYRLAQHFSLGLAASTAISIAWLVVIPFLVWKYLRAPYEFLIGIFLFSLPALLLGGPLFFSSRVVAGSLKIPAALVAFVALFAGYDEHMKFLKIRKRLNDNGKLP